MTPEERALIDGLFDRMGGVANQPRDPEAEALIARRLAQAPHATYALAQSVIVQEHALQQTYARVQELEAQLDDAEARAADASARQSGGGFLGGLFGGGSRPSVPSAGGRPAAADRNAPMGLPQGYGQQGYGQQGQPYGQAGYAQQGAPPSGPWGQQPGQPQRGGFGGGGFLQGALATAAGVAGGALLFDGIKGMMSGGQGGVAQAAAAEAGRHAPEPAGGDLGADAQNALGGAPQDQAQDNFWNADPDGGVEETGFDDGGDWGSDDSWT